MAKMRFCTLRYVSEIAEAAGEHEIIGVLRDILPDKGFNIHKITGYIEAQDAPEKSLSLAKNVGRVVSYASGVPPTPQYGAIFITMSRSVGIHTFNVDFKEPLDFDDDDNLNVLFRWSTIGAGFVAGWTLTIYFTEGK